MRNQSVKVMNINHHPILIRINQALSFFVFLLSLQVTFQAKAQLNPPVGSAYNVKNYKAKGDGKTLDTEAINKAIIAASAAGGGTVYFPPGVYLSASIELKSNIAL